MSASLVGSEMCIRDSGSSSGGVGRGITDEAGAGCPTRTTAPSRCSETVSYTHLTLPTICSV
eukprot:12370933-Alexandrium_andersonii.AAC.1